MLGLARHGEGFWGMLINYFINFYPVWSTVPYSKEKKTLQNNLVDSLWFVFVHQISKYHKEWDNLMPENPGYLNTWACNTKAPILQDNKVEYRQKDMFC